MTQKEELLNAIQRREEKCEALEAREGWSYAKMANAVANMQAMSELFGMLGLEDVAKELTQIRADMTVAYCHKGLERSGEHRNAVIEAAKKLDSDARSLNNIF